MGPPRIVAVHRRRAAAGGEERTGGVIKPYYDRDGITIYCADCRDVLPIIEPGSVDLVLTDPPYGIAAIWQGGSGHGWGKARLAQPLRNSWDQSPPDTQTLQSFIALAR